MSLQDRNVVVIGGSSGIGFVVAKLALEAGAESSPIGGRNESRLTEAAQKLPGSQTHLVDISDEAQVAAFFEHVGELDHLVVTSRREPSRLPRDSSDLPIQEARAAFDHKFWGQWAGCATRCALHPCWGIVRADLRSHSAAGQGLARGC